MKNKINNTLNSQNPRKLIADFLEESVRKNHRTSWQPRVVRHNKKINGSRLSKIDYAVPCFDLATSMSEKPEKIARLLTDEFNAHMRHQGSNISEKALIVAESVSGYVNFQLSISLLEKYSFEILQWYRQQEPTSSENTKNVQSYEESVNGDLARLAQGWIASTYGMLGRQINCYNLHVSSKPQPVMDMSFETIEHFLQGANLKRDTDTEAIYLESKNEIIPIRTAKGTLLPAALLLQSAISSLEEERECPTIFLVPQKHHSLVSELGRNPRSTNLSRVVAFDPFVSKADIAEIESNMNNLATLIDESAKVIQTWHLSINTLNETERKHFLRLIDFPAEVDALADNLRLPPIFDSLNGLCRAIKFFNA